MVVSFSCLNPEYYFVSVVLRGEFNKFPDIFFVQAFKIVVDS